MTHPSTPFDDIASDVADPIPEGFRSIKVGGQFVSHNGPLYAKWTGERLLLGFGLSSVIPIRCRCAMAACLPLLPTC